MQQKITLQQKKAKLIMDEVNLKIKERKMRTRRLIEMGGLVAKANLDHLSANTLFGAIVSLKETLTQHPNVQDQLDYNR
ncbi:conjugative transfer protein [Orientia tsutsugamushi]|uniref:Conjugative transfer protein n=1 Tax=Orientia tsutsugamushi TaxID=784 RepID=A0A2U3RPZ6_ORITS|nr:conjugative transfer protein [Orientia tsutsugamushi]